MRRTSRWSLSHAKLELRSDRCCYEDRPRDAGRGDAEVATIVRDSSRIDARCRVLIDRVRECALCLWQRHGPHTSRGWCTVPACGLSIFNVPEHPEQPEHAPPASDRNNGVPEDYRNMRPEQGTLLLSHPAAPARCARSALGGTVRAASSEFVQRRAARARGRRQIDCDAQIRPVYERELIARPPPVRGVA